MIPPGTTTAGFLADLRHGLRGLGRAPVVLVSGVLCLALGIGVNATLVGALDTLWLRPPAHVRDAGALRRLYFRERPGQAPQSEVSYPVYADLAGKVGAFSGLGAWAAADASLGRGHGARKVRAVLATPSLLPLLGVEPIRGRRFTAEEGDPARPGTVALLGWELWQRELGGAADVLGRRLDIGPGFYTVIGVLPRGFTGIDLDPVDLWLPIGAAGPLLARPDFAADRGSMFLNLVARLRPGAAPGRAAEEATAVHRQVHEALGFRDTAGRQVSLGPVQAGHSPWGAPAARLAAWLAGTSGAVLLVACFNVASLLVARGLERRRELAVRLALGAGRARLARLLLAESLALALLGGVAACAVVPLAGALVRAFLLPAGAPATSPLEPRLAVVLAVLTLGSGVLCGLAPALAGSRRDLAAELQGGARTGRPGRTRLRETFLVVQVALTSALLVGAGLFLASLAKVRHLDLGLDAERVLVATLDLAATGRQPAEVDAFLADAAERIRLLPGVERASLAAAIPFRSSFGADVTVPGGPEVPGLAPGGIYFNAVGEDFLATLGIALRRGRTLTAADEVPGAAPVAVVNETMARLLWPGRDPLGRCFLVSGGPCTTVVGVAADSRRLGLTEPPTLQFYVPLPQAPGWMAGRALFVRKAAGAVHGLAGAVRREMQALDPGLPFVDVQPLAELLAPRLRTWRTGATLLTLFGLLALVLAAMGIAATVAHAVAARRRELGIRLALGARPGALVGRIVRWALALTTLGAAAGVGLAALAGRYVGPLLFEVSPRDPWVAAAAMTTVLLAALLASWVPGLAVRKVDPAVAMRAE